ncbi:hypothetical protein [Mumia sp. DW29H23]|uniref:COG1470 family protein n=1 Tax=Mumia sp. DW29H23 TaxID=3421241 RepID=UPI003D69A433
MSFRRLLAALASAVLLVAAPGVEAANASAAPTTAVPAARTAVPAVRTPVVAVSERSARARPRPRVTVRDRDRHLVPGHWATIKVKVRNASRATARGVRVRVGKRSGLTFRKRALRVGALRPGTSRTVLVRVRLDVTASRTLTLSAKARAARTRTAQVRIAPRATTWKGTLEGGEPISFTVSADGRTLRNFTVLRAPGVCANWWDGGTQRPARLDTVVIPEAAIGADGVAKAYVDLPDDEPDYDRRAHVRALFRGGSAASALFSYSEEYADPDHFDYCRTEPHQIPWTATRQ